MNPDVLFLYFSNGTSAERRSHALDLIKADKAGRGMKFTTVECHDPKRFLHDRQSALLQTQDGSTLTVPWLQHLAHSPRDLASTFNVLKERNIALRVLDFCRQFFDSRDIGNSEVSKILWAMAEFDSDLARARTHKAIQEAKDNNLSGRPPVENAIKAKVLSDYQSGTFSARQIAERHGLGRSTVFKIVKEAPTNPVSRK